MRLLNYKQSLEMANIFQKFRLIIWKNKIIRRRHWLLTVFEILIPLLLFLLIAYIRTEISGINKEYHNSSTYFPRNNINYLRDEFSGDNFLYYTPNNDFENQLMERLRLNLEIQRHRISGFKDEETLMFNYTEMSLHTDENIISIIFETSKEDPHPKKLKYTIRTVSNWNTESTFPPFLYPGPMFSDTNYYDSGFLTVQSAIDLAYMQMLTNHTDATFPVDVSLQRFPYPPYMQDHGFSEIYKLVLPIITIFSFLMLCPSLLKRIVEEKSTGIKELMKLMGLKSWMLWIGWFFDALFINTITVSLMVILLKVTLKADAEPVIPLCNGFVLWIFLMHFCIASICFVFLLSTFFNKPTIAVIVGEVVLLVSYFILNSMAEGPNIKFFVKLCMTLVPNMALSMGYGILATYEARNIGLQWSNLFEVPTGNANDLSMGIVILMLLFDSVLFLILTFYVNNVKPGPYGIARPWYYPFTMGYWRPGRVHNTEPININYGRNCEEPSVHLAAGIQIRNLRKSFGNKVAVNGLSMDIYRGQITALLGHNGAGKTTTMSILTGMFSQSSGQVYIDGYDMRYHLDTIRDSLGLCPQHNLLFTDLTVLEHLLFFAKLKGASDKDALTDANNLLTMLQISDKKDNLPNTLSGGMKRKLALGIALIGHAKVLMLDEPTSGMDPEARREIWDLLLRMRGQRTILITTHFMEEADVLGDRIAIMDHGQLQCYGTSLFLKRKYGAGYQLSLTTTGMTNINKITEIVEENVANSSLKSYCGALLQYSLPTDQSSKFPNLFNILESQKEQLSIGNIGMSVTTLEEVFLRVGKLAEEDSSIKSDEMCNYNMEDAEDEDKSELNSYKLQGMSLVYERFLALFYKRNLYSYRKPLIYLIHASLPIFLLMLTILLSRQVSNVDSDDPPFEINLENYGRTEVYFSGQSGIANDIAQIYGKNIPATSKAIQAINLNQAIIQLGTANVAKYRDMLIVGAEFNNTNTKIAANAMYSTIALHASAISFNMLSNAVLQYLKGPQYSITSVNYPIEEKSEASYEFAQTIQSTQIMVLWFVLVPLGLTFLAGMYINFPLTERITNAKQLQLMTGAQFYLYWLACFLWDFILYFLVVIVMLGVVVVMDGTNTFKGPWEIWALFVVFFLYGLSAIPYSYMISFWRKTVAGAFTLLLVSNSVFGLASLVVYGLENINDSTYKNAAFIIKGIFAIIPQFSMSYGLLKFTHEALDNNRCKLMPSSLLEILCTSPVSVKDSCCAFNCSSGNCKGDLSYFSGKKGISDAVGLMIFDVFFYIVIIALIECNVFKEVYESVVKLVFKNSSIRNRIDDDVKKEHDRVDGHLNNTNTVSDILLVHDLEKRYGGRFVAVRGVSFGVRVGECFGLLGVNGAGKTTTFKMLTGDEIPTRGDASINFYRLSKNKTFYLSQIGYCPQFDAINESLTGREMLIVFGRLRGIPNKHLDRQVKYWINLLGLQEYADRLSGNYSGGNKRKLSTALALIGDPPLVLLDEPTSGVDPISRRNLWNALKKIQTLGQSVVLTSHSMEECEALCNRLAIMVNGQLTCMGTIEYLKHRFGQGYTLMLKLRSGASDATVHQLKEHLESRFACVIKDEHQGMLHYHITDPATTWFTLFTTMEDIKSSHSPLVEDYTISATTLEQVFLAFARNQRDEPEVYTTSDIPMKGTLAIMKTEKDQLEKCD